MNVAIDRFTLANGLRVVLALDRTNPVVAVNLWYGVGSRDERPGRTGFAHLFEHMMFQGSANVPNTEHIAHVERIGGSVNGSTWLDRTNYFETVPAHWLELALWLESDRLGFFLPALNQEKLDNQRDVVKNERRWRVDNQPYGDWDERLQALAYPADHPYHHSVIGSMEDLDAASLQDLADFFRTYYTPNNAVLSLCGDFDAAHARSLIDRYFGSIPRGPEPPPLPGRVELPARIGREVRQRVSGQVALPRTYLAYRIPPYGAEGFYAADVAANVLASGKASLLYRSLVRERRVAQSVSAFTFPVVSGAALLVVVATGSADTSPDTLEEVLLSQIETLAASELPTIDVDKAVTGIEARQIVGLQQVSERADQLSMFTMLFDEPERINSELDAYREVSPADLRRFALEYLRSDNRVMLTYVPQAADAGREAA